MVVTTQGVVSDSTDRRGFRRRVRYFAAGMAAVAAALYFLIGFQVVTVIDKPEDQAAFAIPAGIGFALAALVILLTDRKVVWVTGGIVQALIIVMYFSLSSQRVPAFEGWGISIRVAQILLLAALGYLAVGRRERASTATATAARVERAAT